MVLESDMFGIWCTASAHRLAGGVVIIAEEWHGPVQEVALVRMPFIARSPTRGMRV